MVIGDLLSTLSGRYILWLFAHLLGFPLGEMIGGREGVPGILGDLFYGLSFGLPQTLVLLSCRKILRSWLYLWPVVSALGFTLGVRVGAKISFLFSSETTELSIIFGIIVGTCVGLLQLPVILRFGRQGLIWLPVSILAWISGEFLAFQTHFQAEAVPLVGMVIGTINGLALTWLVSKFSSNLPAPAAEYN
jgi:hypothetical protein